MENTLFLDPFNSSEVFSQIDKESAEAEQEPKNYNFSDLTPESQREIFIKNMAFDVAANWVSRFSGMPITTARAALLGSAILESQEMSDEAIATFWRAIDRPDEPVII